MIKLVVFSLKWITLHRNPTTHTLLSYAYTQAFLFQTGAPLFLNKLALQKSLQAFLQACDNIPVWSGGDILATLLSVTVSLKTEEMREGNGPKKLKCVWLRVMCKTLKENPPLNHLERARVLKFLLTSISKVCCVGTSSPGTNMVKERCHPSNKKIRMFPDFLQNMETI